MQTEEIKYSDYLQALLNNVFILLGLCIGYNKSVTIISGPDWVCLCDFSPQARVRNCDQMEEKTLMEEGRKRPGVLVVGSSGVGKRTLLSRTCLHTISL